jgi:hypothetical protein
MERIRSQNGTHPVANGTHPDVSGTPSDVSGPSADYGRTQKERVRVKNDIFNVYFFTRYKVRDFPKGIANSIKIGSRIGSRSNNIIPSDKDWNLGAI